MTKDTRIIDFAAEIRHETANAYLLDIGSEEPVWFPKSIIQNNDDGTFSVPEWMAKDKGVI